MKKILYLIIFCFLIVPLINCGDAETFDFSKMGDDEPPLEDISDPEPEPTDADGDGIAAEDDCNDNDATIYPGALDLIGDGIDQNCSGQDKMILSYTIKFDDDADETWNSSETYNFEDKRITSYKEIDLDASVTLTHYTLNYTVDDKNRTTGFVYTQEQPTPSVNFTTLFEYAGENQIPDSITLQYPTLSSDLIFNITKDELTSMDFLVDPVEDPITVESDYFISIVSISTPPTIYGIKNGYINVVAKDTDINGAFETLEVIERKTDNHIPYLDSGIIYFQTDGLNASELHGLNSKVLSYETYNGSITPTSKKECEETDEKTVVCADNHYTITYDDYGFISKRETYTDVSDPSTLIRTREYVYTYNE